MPEKSTRFASTRAATQDQASVSLNPRFEIVLRVLLVMIIGLMALGAGVRTMNAGLSCPDWPLCFGKVIPDFHPAVWFEFVHRAYAGIVALVFLGSAIFSFRSKSVPRGVKRAAAVGLLFLTLQIVAGGLTVLLQVKAIIVTMHLMLATCFFLSVLWMNFAATPAIERASVAAPQVLRGILALPVLIFTQIFIGGLVASTYSGSVCVDWPLCNGQWVPTWTGAIGLQIVHRLMAYGLALLVPLVALLFWRARSEAWMTRQILRLTQGAAAVVCLQVVVGIANLMYFIPPTLTVIHQSIAIVLLAINVRLWFVTSALVGSRAADRVPLAGTPSSSPSFL